MDDQTKPETLEPSEETPQSSPAVSSDDFAKLLATSKAAKAHRKGASVKGTVVQIGEGDGDVLVDVGGKSEAVIARAELLDKDGALTVKVGDTIEAKVIETDGVLRISRKMVASSAGKQMLMEAFKNHLPVQGKVTASIKGGYEVQVAGVRGFCPFSQIDVRRQEDPTLYFNKTFDFAIKEYDPRKRNLILSRRALMEKETRKKEEEVRAQIIEGAVMKGTVISFQDFGAFIDLGGGVQGMMHVSEISHARIAHPKDLLTVGQTLDVQVLRIDQKKNKISLTRKPLESDPWVDVALRFKEGQVIAAKVVRVAEFGAFVELAPGVDGLVHVSELGGGGKGGGKKAQDLAKAGDELKVTILKVDEARRRISLGVPHEWAPVGEKVQVAPIKVGEVVKGKVEKVEKFGVFVRIGPGRVGMIPNNELGTAKGTDHRKMFPAGTEMQAEVIESDASGRKIRLSLTKAKGREEREAMDKYKKDASKSGGGSISTMADAFKAFKESSRGEGSA